MLNKKLERKAPLQWSVDLFQSGKHICRFDWRDMREIGDDNYQSKMQGLRESVESGEISARKMEFFSEFRDELTWPWPNPSTEQVIDAFLTSYDEPLVEYRRDSCNTRRPRLDKGDAICFGEKTPNGTSCHRVIGGSLLKLQPIVESEATVYREEEEL